MCAYVHGVPFKLQKWRLTILFLGLSAREVSINIDEFYFKVLHPILAYDQETIRQNSVIGRDCLNKSASSTVKNIVIITKNTQDGKYSASWGEKFKILQMGKKNLLIKKHIIICHSARSTTEINYLQQEGQGTFFLLPHFILNFTNTAIACISLVREGARFGGRESNGQNNRK